MFYQNSRKLGQNLIVSECSTRTTVQEQQDGQEWGNDVAVANVLHEIGKLPTLVLTDIGLKL